ncbi:MAG: S9 family peptidase, partial [Paludibacterium sp.]|nr:S9 family peptidase [Paludibacterium sp.]
MTTPTITAPFGAWPSPISAARVAAGSVPLSGVAIDGHDLYWLAGRAAEAGRNTLMRLHGNQSAELTPMPFNVRTRVHEYGGGAYAVDGGTVWFSHFADNMVYRLDEDAAPVALTRPGKQRFADFVVDRPRQRLIGIR